MTYRSVVVFVALGVLAVSVQIALGCKYCKESPVVLPPNIAAAIFGRGPYGFPPAPYGVPPAPYGIPPGHYFGHPPLVSPAIPFHSHTVITPALYAGCGHQLPAPICRPPCPPCSSSPTRFVQKPDVHITLPLPAEISLGKVCSVQKFALRPAVLPPPCSSPCGRACGCGCA